LEKIGSSPVNIWEKLIMKENRFFSTSTEFLFGHFINARQFPELDQWRRYTISRYSWMTETSVE
jgi:hypothetical protein